MTANVTIKLPDPSSIPYQATVTFTYTSEDYRELIAIVDRWERRINGDNEEPAPMQ